MLEALADVPAHGLTDGLRLSRRLEDDPSAGGAELTDGTLADSNGEGSSSSSSSGFVALVVFALLVLVAFLAARAQDNDGQSLCLGTAAQHAAQLDPRQMRHHPVKNRQIGMHILDHR